jgi:hypothetical protein
MNRSSAKTAPDHFETPISTAGLEAIAVTLRAETGQKQPENWIPHTQRSPSRVDRRDGKCLNLAFPLGSADQPASATSPIGTLQHFLGASTHSRWDRLFTLRDETDLTSRSASDISVPHAQCCRGRQRATLSVAVHYGERERN